MQNLPPAFKGFLQADPGYVLVEMDKRQSEWVIVAYLSGDKRMIEIVESGVDPHAATAELITKVPLWAIKQESSAIGHITDPEEIATIRESLVVTNKDISYSFKTLCSQLYAFLPRTMTCRQLGKKSNHALNYMMGANKFSLISGLTVQEAEKVRTAYLRSYSGLHEWWREVAHEVTTTGAVRNPFGQLRSFYGEVSETMYREAVATLPQSTSVYMVNRAMILIYHDLSISMHPVQLLGQGHDSILFQYPLASIEDVENLQRACQLAKEYMEPLIPWKGKFFRVQTDIKLGFSWDSGMTECPVDSISYMAKSFLNNRIA